VNTASFWYRDFLVSYDPPPIPHRDMDWHFVHDDFDGAPDAHDPRHGRGPTAQDCVRQIDEMMDEDDDQLRWETDPSPIGLEDDAEALASAGMVEEP